MDQFAEALSQLSDLSDDDLSALEASIIQAFDDADEAGDMESMSSYADDCEQVRNEMDSRTSGNANPSEDNAAPVDVPMAASAEVAEVVSEPVSEPVIETEPVAPVVEAVEPVADTELEVVSEPVVEAEAETVAEPVIEAEPVVEVAETVEPEPVADIAETPASEAVADEVVELETAAVQTEEEEVADPITAEDVPEGHLPVAASGPVVTIRAGGDVPGVSAGSELTGMDGIVDALTRKIDSMRHVNSGDGEHIVVASMRVEEDIPEDRKLYAGDMNGNARKIRELLNNRDALTAHAITAAAWCAPRMSIYDVPTVGTNRRPVQAGLPTFNADRGGVRFIAPPAIPTAGGTASGVSLWHTDGTSFSAFTDPANLVAASPSTDKPQLTVACGTEVIADVDAIPVILCFDNLTNRAFPEWVRANTEMTMIYQARFAEQVLLNKMFNLVATGCSTASPTTTLGVARDFMTVIRAAATEKRWTLRLDPEQPLQLLAPSWLVDAMAADLHIQHPGDGTLALARAEIEGYFANLNVQPIWYMDDVPGTAGFTGHCAFPTTANWLLYTTGSFLRLDNGELNLGIVRTKDDLVKNKYCEFSETFETVTYTGPINSAWVTKGQTTVVLKGSWPNGITLS